jgi:hypothetical protein
MILDLMNSALSRLPSVRNLLVVPTLLGLALIPSIASGGKALGKSKLDNACGVLHAAIRAELVRRDPPYTQPPFVMLSFILLNDGDTPVNSVEGDGRSSSTGRN